MSGQCPQYTAGMHCPFYRYYITAYGKVQTHVNSTTKSLFLKEDIIL